MISTLLLAFFLSATGPTCDPEPGLWLHALFPRIDATILHSDDGPSWSVFAVWRLERLFHAGEVTR